MGRLKSTDELLLYKQTIGEREYTNQYHYLFMQPKTDKTRYSKLEYENPEEKIMQIKEKYKNGVTTEHITEMLNDFF